MITWPHRSGAAFLFWCLQYYGGGSKGYDCPVLKNNPLAVTKYSVKQECASQAGKVSERIVDLACRFLFYCYYAMASVHAAVISVNGYGNVVSGIVSAYYVFSLLQGKTLAESENILHNRD